MGGFSGNTNPNNSRQITPERVQAFMQSDNPLARAASYFMSNTNFGSKLGGLLNGLWGQLGQGGNQQGNTQTMPGGTPQQGSQSAYPGFQMPAYTYHRSMPQFTFDNGTYGGTTAPAAGMNLYGGALNLPGWAMQQAGQTPTAGNWRPDITNGNGGGGGNGAYMTATQILQNHGGLHPQFGDIKFTAHELPKGWQQHGHASDDAFLRYLMQARGALPYGADAAGVSGVSGNGPEGTDGGIY